MAKFKFRVLVDPSSYITAKISDDIKDTDVGKAVILNTALDSTYKLTSNGAAIDGFIVGLEAATADGEVLATIQISGRKRCEAEAAMNIGDLVESGVVAAAGTAETSKLPQISTLTRDTTTAITLAADLHPVVWRVISGNTTDGVIDDEDTTVIIERV